MSKVAIVTGGSRGIGAAISQRLAADGFAVLVNYAGRAAEAEAIVGQIETAGGQAKAAQADIADPAAVRGLFDTAEAAWGGVDVLVNNAGIMTQAPIAEVTDEDFDRLIAVNLKGSFNAMREAARRLRDGGRIINLSTTLVASRMPTYGVYAATKGAIEVMTGILSKELGARGISVNAVAPGGTATELFLTGKSAEMLERMAKASPLGRLGEPADIAGVVAFLAGPEGGWVNGQTVRVNGGTA